MLLIQLFMHKAPFDTLFLGRIIGPMTRMVADSALLLGELAKPVDGFFDLPQGPGLGMDLLPEVLTRPDLITRRTEV